jgi:hypothetical protein
MKKNLFVLTVMMAVIALSSGCGKTENSSDTDQSSTTQSNTTSTEVADESLKDLMAAQEEISKNYDENDPEAATKMMEAYAEYGAQVELDEFEKTEAIDAPSYFPTALIYSKGKITESSDSGDESYINKSITIETTENLKTVKEFYKNLFSQLTWKLTSQSSESDSASFDATDSAAIDANVYIYASPYSKIVSISITYSGTITE